PASPNRQVVFALTKTFSSKFIWFVSNRLQWSRRPSNVEKTIRAAYVFAIQDAEVRRLIIRPGAIGDFILSLPALECLRAGYLEVWTTPRTVPLVRFAECGRSISST